MRGGTERGDSLVKEGWYTNNYSEENTDLPFKKKRKVYINAMINLSEKALGYIFLQFKNYFLQALLSIILGFQDIIWNHIYFKVVYIEIHKKLTEAHHHCLFHYPECTDGQYGDHIICGPKWNTSEYEWGLTNNYTLPLNRCKERLSLGEKKKAG